MLKGAKKTAALERVKQYQALEGGGVVARAPRPRSTLEYMSVLAEYVAGWRPDKAWASTVAQAAAVIETSKPGGELLEAWCQIAMVLGDSRAAPLALIVCLHAERTAPHGYNLQRVHSHRNLCLMELGLATIPERLIPIRDMHQVVHAVSPSVDQWLARELVPVGGDLSRAARFVLALALARLDLAAEPPWPS